MTGEAPGRIDLAALRRQLAGTRGRDYWRSLGEVAQTAEFQSWLQSEFPGLAAGAASVLDRRRFLQLTAASLALAGLSGCGPEPEPRYLVPQIAAPPGIVPGVPRYYATATLLDGFATGVLVKHNTGRPIKIEGNPGHPASLGATSPWGQASILGLYDPGRSQTIVSDGRVRTWDALVSTVQEQRRAWLQKRGKGLRLLTGAVTSPTLVGQIHALAAEMPELVWHRWEPLSRDNVHDGAQRAFGRPLDTVYDVERADIVLAIGSDFLSAAPGHLRYARQFASRRRAAEIGDRMSRLYAIESTPTLAGAMADHRWALRPDELAQALGEIAGMVKGGGTAPSKGTAWTDAVAQDLARHHGAALVHIGREQPAEIHALAHAINEALGAPSSTLHYIEPVAPATASGATLADLVTAMQAGDVDALVILGGNPVYDAPADLDFAAALQRVPFSLHLGLYFDETAGRCHWHVPQTHEYEAWSDARAFDGTATILQPQVRPIYDGRSVHEVTALLQGQIDPDGMALVRNMWNREAASRGVANADDFWTESLRKGLVADTAAPPVAVTAAQGGAGSAPAAKASGGETIEVLFRADEAVWDGRFANNGWLQEMPRPLTTLTWDNAALIAPATAERLKLADQDIVELSDGSAKLRAPVLVLPGQAADCVTLPLGLGRAAGGEVAQGVGFDAYKLRRGDGLWRRGGITVKKIDGTWPLALRQHHQTMAGRDIVRSSALAEFLDDHDFLKKSIAKERSEKGEVVASLYPPYPYDGNAWAMAVNLNSCIGCGACVLACQAENNLAIVGKEEVLRGHEMHWLRVDRYYSGSLDAPDTYFQPVPCMHCENAPCEVVCPVQATVHDSDGLNVMVYNRCVGTRFCSNNCPYKVRRFNFFDYTSQDPRPRESWNPDVSVRARGVMEKCTYCIQRIREAKIAADRENRTIRDGEVRTACQQACPTEAIVFGDKNDHASAVVRRKSSPLDYALLDGLNTRPRTTYEARLHNRNPDIGEAEG